MTRKKLAVYTAIFGDYDKLIDDFQYADCDFVCFTDNSSIKSELFDMRVVETEGRHAARESRRYKALSNRYLSDYEYTLWLDGSVKFLQHDYLNFVTENLVQHDIALFRHPDDDSIYLEANRCHQYSKDDPELINAQIEAYRREGCPHDTGLFAGGVICAAIYQRRLKILIAVGGRK